ncbi:MAG: sulfatase [Bacteroidales bacterium]|nr:sulfatase [Bacteroidales bacterium]
MKLLFKTLILCLVLQGSTLYSQPQEKPNFIIMIADDAGWRDFGAYGNSGIRTPNIDQLAREGLIFTNAFLTTSSCSPSRCSILSGRYPHNTGAPNLGMPLPEDQLIFPGELKKAGYYTAASGKWHIGPQRPDFDTTYGWGGPSGCGFWETALQERPKDKPFFMWFAAVDPHRGYKAGTIPEPHTPSSVTVPPYLPDNDSVRKDIAMYYDEITRLDSYVGKVMGILEKQGIKNNTVVIFMSDNGSPFPRAKNRLYDSGIKMPFIVRWPDEVRGGTTTSSLVSSIDIFPTFCELAGLKIPNTTQGVPFSRILKKPNKQIRKAVYAEHNWHDFQAHERSVRTDRYLYIWNAFPELNANPPGDVARGTTFQEMIQLFNNGALTKKQEDCFIAPRPEEELYDVINDPYQMNNLAGDDQSQRILKKMRKKLQLWKEETNDSVPENPKPDRGKRWYEKNNA